MESLWGYLDATRRILAPPPVRNLLPGLPPVSNSPLAARNPDIGRTVIPGLSWMKPLPGSTAASGMNGGGGSGGNGNGSSSNGNSSQAPESLIVVGQPSLRVYLDPQTHDTIVELQRRTRHGAQISHDDIARIQAIAENVLLMMRQMSQGPYTQKMLAKLGHPYGFDVVTNKLGQKISKARHVPGSFQGAHIGKIKGVRGSVPTLTVINKQSGQLAQSWELDLIQTPDLLTIQWRNTAKTDRGFPYAWALAHGTMAGGLPRMQAHGPWTYAPVHYLPALDAAWRGAALNAWRRERAQSMLSQS